MRGRVLIGTSGWSYGHWKGAFYPDTLPRAKWFTHYAENFATVEINYSFYRMPSASTIERWRRATPPGFSFAMKAPRFITHMKKLNVEKSRVDAFVERVRGLKEKLGPILYQLPRQQGKDLAKLERFARILPRGFRHAVEFRNDSWIDEETFSLLADHAICYCIVSAPRLQCQRRATAPFVYVRMHGAESWYRSDYSDVELADWASYIREAIREGVDVYVYFNNDYRAYAVRNATTLCKIMRSFE